MTSKSVFSADLPKTGEVKTREKSLFEGVRNTKRRGKRIQNRRRMQRESQISFKEREPAEARLFSVEPEVPGIFTPGMAAPACRGVPAPTSTILRLKSIYLILHPSERKLFQHRNLSNPGIQRKLNLQLPLPQDLQES